VTDGNLSSQEMFESALANFDVAVKLQSDFTAHVWRGATLKQLSRYDKAILDFDRAIALEANAAYHFMFLPLFVISTSLPAIQFLY
jgi:predicted RNA polymerase sigma factor